MCDNATRYTFIYCGCSAVDSWNSFSIIDPYVSIVVWVVYATTLLWYTLTWLRRALWRTFSIWRRKKLSTTPSIYMRLNPHKYYAFVALFMCNYFRWLLRRLHVSGYNSIVNPIHAISHTLKISMVISHFNQLYIMETQRCSRTLFLNPKTLALKHFYYFYKQPSSLKSLLRYISVVHL